MRKKTVFLWIASFLLLFHLASAQQDPFDQGAADTLYFSAGGQHSDNGDTLYLPPDSTAGDVVILINFWNDYEVRGFSIPLVDSCYGAPGNAYLDPSKNEDIVPGEGYPICFAGSRVADLGFGSINLTQNPPDVLYGMVCTTSVGSGQGLFATMVYAVSYPTTICLDTIYFPPENFLKFVRTDLIGYRPIFLPDTFYVDYRPNKPPVVDAQEGDSVALKDSIEILFTAEDPDNDSLLDTPEIEIIPDCGEFHVERTDTGAFTGTWELTFAATFGCSVRTYSIVMGVEDKYGAKGADTIGIKVWKPNHPPVILYPDTVFGYTDTIPGYEDTITFIFSAFDPDSDVITLWDEGFWEPSCAEMESLNQISGEGTFEGVWKAIFRTANCTTSCDYKLFMSVIDERSSEPGDEGWTFDTSFLCLDIKPTSPPIVEAPDETLSVWIDYELSFTFYAADPDSHTLLDTASISVIPSCGGSCEYGVERLWGSEGPSGEWQVQFNAYGSDSNYYLIILDIEDDHDSTGYDTVVVHVYPRPNYNPEVFAPPNLSTYFNDTVQYIFTAADPDSNKLLDMASITIEPDCGSAFAVRQAGPHFFTGTWKLTFYTLGCTLGIYNVIVDVQDNRDGVGYDTTAILITDRPNREPVVVAPHLIEGMAGQTLKYNFSAMDPDTNVILNLANVVVTPNCGVYFANRTAGMGTYTGIWEVTFKTTGCSPSEYQIYMEVQDAYGMIGYAFTDAKLNPSKVEDEEGSDVAIDRFALNQNYPNPFNLSTEISFQIPVQSKVVLKIYNAKGQLVRTLIDGKRGKGLYTIRWNGRDQSGKEVASGIYFYKLTAGDFSAMKKMVLLK
jgi:hypothetical protein